MQLILHGNIHINANRIIVKHIQRFQNGLFAASMCLWNIQVKGQDSVGCVATEFRKVFWFLDAILVIVSIY